MICFHSALNYSAALPQEKYFTNTLQKMFSLLELRTHFLPEEKPLQSVCGGYNCPPPGGRTVLIPGAEAQLCESPDCAWFVLRLSFTAGQTDLPTQPGTTLPGPTSPFWRFEKERVTSSWLCAEPLLRGCLSRPESRGRYLIFPFHNDHRSARSLGNKDFSHF